MYTWLPANLVALVKQGSGFSTVQHTCPVLQGTCMCCLHACLDSKPSKVVHLSSISGNAIHGCQQTWWPLSSMAVVLVLCNTLVLYCKTLACAACMHASTTNHKEFLTIYWRHGSARCRRPWFRFRCISGYVPRQPSSI